MILRLGLFLLVVNFVTTSEGLYKEGDFKNSATNLDNIYSFWPSVHNAARVMKLRKREAQGQVGQNEGGGTDIKVQNAVVVPQSGSESSDNNNNKPATNSNNSTTNTLNKDQLKANETPNELQKNVIQSNTNVTKTVTSSETKGNETAISHLDINNPGVLKRGLIVFGGFALMAGAYFIFYRMNNKKNDANNLHNTSESNHCRYGVLQSDDRRENMELSRIPLTMDSDDDDDEDLEIFDLGQKKKSLSYANLQTDENKELNILNNIDKEEDNLLLDIENTSGEHLDKLAKRWY